MSVRRDKIMLWVLAPSEESRSMPLCDELPSVLLLQVNARRGGQWHPITGWVDDEDECLQAAALREMFEETGLKQADRGMLKDLSVSLDFESRFGPAREHVFGVFLHSRPKSLQLDASEHDACIWVGADQVNEFITWQKDIWTQVMPRLLMEWRQHCLTKSSGL